jgi:multifunctional methyltransferase subunit TRM112
LQIVLTEGESMKQESSELNADLIKNLLPKLNWPALKQTAKDLQLADLPNELPSDYASDAGFIQSVHDLIMDIHVLNGYLQCPNCARKYPIVNGVPNMILKEDEL